MCSASPCTVPGCAALGDGGRCPVHQHAALAASTNFAVGTKCDRCKRLIERDDWVDAQPSIDVIAGIMIHRFRHVGCRPPRAAPRTQRKAVADLPFDADPDPDPPLAARVAKRFEIPGSHTSWRDPDGQVHELTIGAHSVDLSWPWWRPWLLAR